ncbi:MAG: YceI family protein [Solirubrobacteraceae bacterium]
MSSQPAAVTAPSSVLPEGTWKVDPVHSSVEFQVKHLGIANVKGQFTEFEGTLEVGHGEVNAYGTVNVASVDTRQSQRDDHLRSPDFFDAENFPQITFRSVNVRALDEDSFEIEGDLTIHGVTKRVSLNAALEGRETDPQGNERVGLSASGQINRSEYDMKFNAALGSGNMVVSDKVKIQLDISAVKAD